MIAGATAVALGFDALDATRPFSVVTTGLLDEPAHLALAALCLLAMRPLLAPSRAFAVATLVASVAIDLDHVPLYLGVSGISAQPGGRPYTHSLLTVFVALAVAVAVGRWRAAAAGTAFGMLVHLIRDVCEGRPGVSLLWPISGHEFLGTQQEFRGLVVALALLAGWGQLRMHPAAISRR